MALALLLLAGGLRSYRLVSPDLWVDEANSVIIAQQSLPNLVGRLMLDSSPPLYYFLLRFWMHTFGDSEAAVRAISVIAGAGVVGWIFVLGRRLFTQEIGALAAALVAVSPVQIYYSQQARMYSLLALVAWLSAYWLWRAVSDGRARFVVAYGISTLAALYIHNCGLYLLPAHLAVLLWSGAVRKRPVVWSFCGGCIVAGYLPWLPVFLRQLENRTHYSWFLPFWQHNGLAGSLAETLGSFAPGGPQPPYVQLAGVGHAAWLPAVLFTLAAGLGLVRLFRPASDMISGKVGMIWLLFCLCIPVGAALAASLVVTPNYVPGRSDQMVFPGFVLLVAIGLSVIRPAVLRYALFAVFLVFSAVSLRGYYNTQMLRGDRTLAQVIAARGAPGDAVLTTSLTRASLEYYLGRDKSPIRLFSYPRSTALHLGNQDDTALLEDPGQMEEEVRLVKKEIEQQCGPHARVFLVLAGTPVNGALYNDLIGTGHNQVLADLGEFQQAVTGIPVFVLLLQL